MATQDELKNKTAWAQALLASLSLLKEISLAVLTVVAQYFQFKANKAETRASALETELTIKNKVEEIEKAKQNKTARQRIDDFLRRN